MLKRNLKRRFIFCKKGKMGELYDEASVGTVTVPWGLLFSVSFILTIERIVMYNKGDQMVTFSFAII